MAERTSTNAHRAPGAWQDASRIDDKDRKNKRTQSGQEHPKRHEAPKSAIFAPSSRDDRAIYGMARRILGFEEEGRARVRVRAR
jgi:hypothetical protein